MQTTFGRIRGQATYFTGNSHFERGLLGYYWDRRIHSPGETLGRRITEPRGDKELS